MITPFDPTGKYVDYDQLRALAEAQVQAGNSVCILGTTGEAPTIEEGNRGAEDERGRIIREVVDQVRNRVRVIVGTGTNFTSDAVGHTNQAAELGADGVLVVTPYYNKPSQRDIVDNYYRPIGEVDLPVIMYDIPGRTATKMDPETIVEASRLPGIIGLKFASGDFDQLRQVRRDAPNLPIWSGDDANTLNVMREGGVGVVSVASNADPNRVHNLVDLASQENWDGAQAIDTELAELIKACFPEGWSNPRGIKYLMHLMSRGAIHNVFRQPLGPLPEEFRPRYQAILTKLGLI